MKYEIRLLVLMLLLAPVCMVFGKIPPGRPALKIAVVLPFFAGSDSTELSRHNLQIRKAAFDYYEGLLLAADSLSSLGLSIDLHVFDSEKKGERVTAILSEIEKLKPDLLFGPALRQTLKPVADWSRKNKVPIITPFIFYEMPDTIGLYGHYTHASFKAQALHFAKRELAKVNNSLILLDDGSEQTKEVVKYLSDSIGLRSTFRIVKWQNVGEIAARANETCTIIFPTDNMQVAASVLKNLKNGDDTLKIVVPESWQRFPNADFALWNQKGVRMLSSYWPDAAAADFAHLHQRLFERVQGEVTQFAVRGFSDMMFFSLAASVFGDAFPLNITNTYFENSGSYYYFTRAGNSWENAGYRLLRFSDFRFVPVPEP